MDRTAFLALPPVVQFKATDCAPQDVVCFLWVCTKNNTELSSIPPELLALIVQWCLVGRRDRVHIAEVVASEGSEGWLQLGSLAGGSPFVQELIRWHVRDDGKVWMVLEGDSAVSLEQLLSEQEVVMGLCEQDLAAIIFGVRNALLFLVR